MEFQNALHLIVAIERKLTILNSHRLTQFFIFSLDRPNWQDWGGRWARRTAFMRNLKIILEELDINYTMPIQPVLLPTSGPPPHSLTQLQPPPSGSHQGSASADLGNAGGFQPSDISLAPGKSFQSGIPSFR